MSRLVVRNGTVIDPASERNAPGHVLVDDGRIFGVVDEVPTDWSGATEVDATDKWVVPGLICLRTHVCEPGYEWREDVASASRAAAAGGFTTVCATPDTDPVNDVRAVTEQIVTRNALAPGARVLPVGAATIGLEGKHLSEMGDLRDAGCVAISTGEQSIPTARMMRRVLEYARSVNLPVFGCVEDGSLGAGAVMHEGAVGLRLGMPAVPSEAESTALFRDGMMARLAGWPLHVQRLSTADGVAVLRLLRAQGIEVTADVTPHHLWFTEEAVRGFDTNTRVQPPLRAAADVAALREALAEGLIGAVATDHMPQSTIEKMVEYKWSHPGTTGLETALGVMLELVRQGVMPLLDALRRLTCGPAEVLRRSDLGRIAEGATADLVVVDASMPRRVESGRMQTRSRNCIWDGMDLSGRVEVTVVGGEVVWSGEEEPSADRQAV